MTNIECIGHSVKKKQQQNNQTHLKFHVIYTVVSAFGFVF